MVISLAVWLRMHCICSSQKANNKEEVEDMYLAKLQVTACLLGGEAMN